MARYKRTRPLGHGLQEMGGDPALGAGVVAHMLPDPVGAAEILADDRHHAAVGQRLSGGWSVL